MRRFNIAKAGAKLPRARGFTLIELLVGIMVAILASSAIMVSFSVFDNRKRTTQSGSDAQVNGAYALQMMERQIRMGGYGFAGGNSANDDTPSGCILSGGFNNWPAATGLKTTKLDFAINTAMAVPPAAALMAPVLIVDDANNQGAGGSDVIRVMYGDSSSVAPYEPNNMVAGGNTITVNANGYGVNVGDTVLIHDFKTAAPPANVRRCVLRRVSAVDTNTGLLTFAPPGFNDTTVSPNPVGPDSSSLSLMSLRNFRILTFSTLPAPGANGAFPAQMQAANVLYQYEARTNWVAPQQFELSPDIVNIQAQYGLDSNPIPVGGGGVVVDQWVNATAAAGWDQASIVNRMQATPLDPNNPNTFSPMARVKAVRLALVARSTLLEQRRVAGGCNAPGADQPMGTATLRVNGLLEFNWPDGTVGQANVQASDVNNWSCYRYQVFQTVIPLRSVIWSKVK